MRKIDSPGVERIEHCRARHPHDEVEHDKKATLDYEWMLGVCYGNSLTKGVNCKSRGYNLRCSYRKHRTYDKSI